MRNAVGVIVLLLAWAALAQGATFVVAPHGDDANPGSEQQPLA